MQIGDDAIGGSAQNRVGQIALGGAQFRLRLADLRIVGALGSEILPRLFDFRIGAVNIGNRRIQGRLRLVAPGLGILALLDEFKDARGLLPGIDQFASASASLASAAASAAVDAPILRPTAASFASAISTAI